MTTALFFGWLKSFQDYFAISPDRKVVLLIDNCSAHGRADNLPTLPNVKISLSSAKLHLKNTASRLWNNCSFKAPLQEVAHGKGFG